MSETLIDDHVDKLQELRSEFFSEIKDCDNSKKLEQLRIKYLSKKGLLQKYFFLLGTISQDIRPRFGKELNLLRNDLTRIIQEETDKFKEVVKRKEGVDVSLPGFRKRYGKKHPLTQTFDEIKSIFTSKSLKKSSNLIHFMGIFFLLLGARGLSFES